jgi:hypothetical protein
MAMLLRLCPPQVRPQTARLLSAAAHWWYLLQHHGHHTIVPHRDSSRHLICRSTGVLAHARTPAVTSTSPCSSGSCDTSRECRSWELYCVPPRRTCSWRTPTRTRPAAPTPDTLHQDFASSSVNLSSPGPPRGRRPCHVQAQKLSTDAWWMPSRSAHGCRTSSVSSTARLTRR